MDQPIENSKGMTGSQKREVQSSRKMCVFIGIEGMATGRIEHKPQPHGHTLCVKRLYPLSFVC